MAVPLLSLSAVTPALLHTNGPVNTGNVDPFCPAFIYWSEYPQPEGIEGEAAVHGLGIIPAPVSLVQSSLNTKVSRQKPVLSPVQLQGHLTTHNQRFISANSRFM